MRVLLTLAVLFLAIPAYANHTSEHAGPFQTVTVEVNGLVCDFCARTLEKVFYQQEGVEGVKVDLDTHIVTLEIKEGTDLPDEKITSLVTDSGYNVVKISRPE